MVTEQLMFSSKRLSQLKNVKISIINKSTLTHVSYSIFDRNSLSIQKAAQIKQVLSYLSCEEQMWANFAFHGIKWNLQKKEEEKTQKV